MKNIAIFGIHDGSVGQLINMLPKKIKKDLNCIFSIHKKVIINIKKEQKIRPNKKTEFIIKNKIYNMPVFFGSNFMEILLKKKIKKVFIFEDESKDRKLIFNKIKKYKKIKILNYIHQSVKLMGSNDIGEGVIIFPDNYIGYKSDIGNSSILQQGCKIGHHNAIGDFCNINPNVTTGGFTKIGNSTEINISVDIINRIKIGNNSRIFAGSLILNNVGNDELHCGRPARFLRKIT